MSDRESRLVGYAVFSYLVFSLGSAVCVIDSVKSSFLLFPYNTFNLKLFSIVVFADHLHFNIAYCIYSSKFATAGHYRCNELYSDSLKDFVNTFSLGPFNTNSGIQLTNRKVFFVLD